MKYTNKHNIPKAMVEAISKNTYDLNKLDPHIISVTSLINPPKIQLLKLRHNDEIEEDLGNNIFRLFGSAEHEVVGRINPDDRIIEKRFYIDTTSWEIFDKEQFKEHYKKFPDRIYIAGKPDLYDEKEKSVEDWKITSVYAIKDGAKDEWEEQINSYCWFIRKLKLKVKKLRINTILRDWRTSESKRIKDYPPIPYKSVIIPIWSSKDQQKFIEKRLAFYLHSQKLPDNKIKICSPEERWRTEEVYATYKGRNKRALKLFGTKKEAKKFMKNYFLKHCEKLKLEKREAVDKRCLDYCSVNIFCNYYKKNYEEEN